MFTVTNSLGVTRSLSLNEQETIQRMKQREVAKNASLYGCDLPDILVWKRTRQPETNHTVPPRSQRLHIRNKEQANANNLPKQTLTIIPKTYQEIKALDSNEEWEQVYRKEIRNQRGNACHSAIDSKNSTNHTSERYLCHERRRNSKENLPQSPYLGTR